MTDSVKEKDEFACFTETMRGFWSDTVRDADYQRAFTAGQQANSSFSFTLSVIADDLDALLEQDTHAARMIGTVTAPSLSPDPLTATDGIFNLLVKDPERYAATGGWGFAQFKDGKPADEVLLKTCFPCHVPVESRDFVFTHYSP